MWPVIALLLQSFGGAVVHDTMVSLVVQVTPACVAVRAPRDQLGSMYLRLCVAARKAVEVV